MRSPPRKFLLLNILPILSFWSVSSFSEDQNTIPNIPGILGAIQAMNTDPSLSGPPPRCDGSNSLPAQSSRLISALQKLEPTEDLKYSEYPCTVDGQTLTIRELDHSPGGNAKMTLIANPTAHMVLGKDAGYRGESTPLFLKKYLKTRGKNLKPLAYVNGNFFGKFLDLPPKFPGTRAKGLVWSELEGITSPFRPGSKLEKSGGNYIVIWDQNGPISLKLDLTPENGQPVYRIVNSENRSLPNPPDPKTTFPLDAEGIVTDLRARFPTATSMMQLNMPLRDKGEYACPPKVEPVGIPDPESLLFPPDWRCIKAARTVVCLLPNGHTKYLVTTPATPDVVTQAFGTTNACQTGCSVAFNLDGQLSSQVGLQGPKDSSMKVMYPPPLRDKYEPPFRPVQNFFFFYEDFPTPEPGKTQ